MAMSRMDAEAAAQALGLDDLDSATAQDVSDAFRRTVRAAHPDTGEAVEDAPTLLLKARKARDLLRSWIDGQPNRSCSLCGGRGTVNSFNFSTQPCPKCST